jgi:hypothetical protein
LHGAQEPRDGAVHISEMRGIGQPVAQSRREKARRLVDADAALRQQPPNDLGQTVAFGDGGGETGIGIAQSP